jgi:hypothetical protein
MQQAIDLLEKNKVYFDTLQTEVVPLSVAYKAIEMAVDKQLEESLDTISSQMESLYQDINNLNQEND